MYLPQVHMKYMEHFESSSTFTASSHVVETGKLRAAELLLFKIFLEYLCGKFADTSIDRNAHVDGDKTYTFSSSFTLTAFIDI